MARSLYNYTNKPHWTSNAANVPTSGTSLKAHAASETYASPMGWVQGAVGTGVPTTSLSWAAGTVTVSSLNHGLLVGNPVLITGVTPTGYNGYHIVTSVPDANTFTYSLANDPAGSATIQGFAYRGVEVVVAYRDFASVAADVSIIPTFTASISYSGSSTMVTGDVMTITLTSSEPVEVMGSPQIAVTIGANTRQATFNALSSSDTSLVFKYTIVADDSAAAGGVSVASTTNGGYISDKLPANKSQVATVTYVSPDTSLTTVN